MMNVLCEQFVKEAEELFLGRVSQFDKDYEERLDKFEAYIREKFIEKYAADYGDEVYNVAARQARSERTQQRLLIEEHGCIVE